MVAKRNSNVAALKRSLMPPSLNEGRALDEAKSFVRYLERTLIPDLQESGREATAEDFQALAAFLADPELDTSHGWSLERFVEFLEDRLVPDLYESGHELTAQDFETGIRLLREQGRI